MNSRVLASCVAAGVFLLSGCAEPAPTRGSGPEAFDSFARRLHAEMETHPFAAAQQIGLFGDLDVLSGENVVMGRYRYRVDSTGDSVAAHMAFEMLDDQSGRPIPVMFSFASDEHRWKLLDAAIIGGHQPDSVQVLRSDSLEAWASKSVENTQR